MSDDLHRALKDAGLTAFVVGGAIRNLFLGKSAKDVDLALPHSPDELLEKLPGSVLISSAQAYPVVHFLGFELASFRSDGKNRADAQGIRLNATMEEDAQRRDFTINALYADFFTYNLFAPEAKNCVIDPTGMGLYDLEQKIIRLVGDPLERLREDPLRALRAYRFLAQLEGFSLDKDTMEACNYVLDRVRMKV